MKEFLKLLTQRISIIFDAIGYSLKSLRLTMKGQYPKYELLQTSHRLEKGLLNENPKPLWGWEKAERIATLLKVNDDEFSNRTGRGVLKAYIESKKKSDNSNEREMAIQFLERYPEIEQENTLGGALILKREDITIKDKKAVEQLFITRHSCRDCEERLVSRGDINAAIELALRCPSACNRQLTNCYVYQSKELQTIILTANIRAYEMSEFNDWFVSPSIFAGYLSLSLHFYGIGSCVYRKQLYGHHRYNEEMKKKCNIPDDEMIILEIRFGYYKDEFKVAVSNRHNVDDITKYVEE